MATVTTPTGDRIEGVEGSLLDYYRGEANTVGGYTIDDDAAAVTSLPRAMGGDQDEPLAPVVDDPAVQPAPDTGSDTAVDDETADQDAAPAPVDAPVVDDAQPAGDTASQSDGVTEAPA